MGTMNRSMGFATIAMMVTIALTPMLTMVTSPNPLQDFCVTNLHSGHTINGFECKPANKVSVADFMSIALKNPSNTNNSDKAVVTDAMVVEFPGLNTLGISTIVQVDFAKDDINTPHIHPKASEILVVVEGELYGFFVSTNNTLFAIVLKKGELFVFPKGLMYFKLNVGTGTMMAFVGLSNQNPKRTIVAPTLFTLDIKDEVLEKAFKINE